MSIVDKIVKEAEALRVAECNLKNAVDRYNKIKGLGASKATASP